jgi:membrane protein required for colicin V production
VETYDIIMLITLLGATLFGAWKGFAWQVAATSSIVVSYFVAYEFREALAPHLPVDPPVNVFLAMLILYAGTSLVIWLGFRFVSELINKVKLKEFDRQIGAVLGLASGVALCLVITFFAMTLLGETQRQNICDSRSGFYITKVISQVHTLMPHEVHEVIGPYLHSLDKKLQHNGDEGATHGSGDLNSRGLDIRLSPRRIPLSIEGEGKDDRDNGTDTNPNDLPRRVRPINSGQGSQLPKSNSDDPELKIRFGDRDYGIRFGFSKRTGQQLLVGNYSSAITRRQLLVGNYSSGNYSSGKPGASALRLIAQTGC